MTSKARELANLGNAYSDGALSNRNKILNGAMQVAQRGTSSQSAEYQTVDRWRVSPSGTDELVFTQSQDTDAPAGFGKSFKFAVNTPETSFETNEWLYARYITESTAVRQLGYGTSDAKQVTLSFWVKSSVTGDYCILLYNQRVSPTRGHGLTYTINSANTWEYKTLTYDGDTVGSFPDDQLAGLDMYFVLSAGPDRISVDNTTWGEHAQARTAYGQTANVGATSGATWQITGVQLEVGDTATPFEHRSYGDELQRCQRYYVKGNDSGGGPIMRFLAARTDRMDAQITFPVTMRAIPSTTHTADVTAYPMLQSKDGFSVYMTSGLSGSNRQITAWDADAEL